MPAVIRQFFDSYRDAFNRLDGRAVSAHYDLPAMIVDARGNGVFADAAALDANNNALCQHYAQSGFARADFTERFFQPQGDQFCVADLAWAITRHDGSIDHFNTGYTLARREGGWKIAAVTAWQERPFWKENE